MKKLNSKLIIPATMGVLALSFSCKNYLDKPAVSTLNQVVLANKAGVDGLLIGAYAVVDGVYNNQPGGTPWETGTDNWIYGSVAADDAHKGSTPGDQPDAAAIETYTATGVNGYLDPKFRVMLAGAQRANDVLRELPLVKDGSVSPDYAKEVTAEARFLRGFYHMDLAKLWRNVPYVDETVTYDNGNFMVGNPGPIWGKIEADFAAAAADLPETQSQIGRANKWAALAFEAKAYMFDHNYAAALPILANIMAKGKNSSGVTYALGNYENNFNPSTKNGPESVFAAQASVHDGANGLNGNAGNVLNYAGGGPASCCGFFQPSFSFANAFKTDAVTGLPLLDTYNDSDITNDQGIAVDAPFTQYAGTLDSRIDWSMGRRGIPYLDWGLMPGISWARDQADGGPYVPIKNTYFQANAATESDSYGGWAAGQSNTNSTNLIRFADVILWAAEAEIEVGSLVNAEADVNMIRARAANPAGWVHTYIDATKPTGGYTNTPAANYKVGLYTGQIATGSKDFARKAVWFERRIELGMEGHRFFDLQRYDALYGGPGGASYMANVLNAYLAHENNLTLEPKFPALLLKSAKFVAGKNELFPIPQGQIDVTHGTIKQNPGY